MLFPWSFALGQSLLVASVQDCPGAPAVDARVREILGLRDDQALEERATIERAGSSLRVTVRGKDERLLGERVLQAEGSCDELAGAAAVVLATWLSDVHPEFVGAMPENAPPPSPPSVADAPLAALSHARVRAAPRRHWLLGAALGANLFNGAPAPMAALGVRFVPERWGFGAGVAATFVGAREVDLSSGSVRYFRWPVLLGPAFRAPVAAARLEVQAGAALAWLHVEGVDFSPPVSHDDVLTGGFGAARLSLGGGAFTPFAELTGVLWPPRSAFVERGPAEPSVSLPSAELYAALGASWRAW